MALTANVNRSVDAYRKRAYGKKNHTHDFIYSRMKPVLDRNPGASVLDVGCGDGAFIDFLRTRHPQLDCAGLEYDGGLIAKAKASGRFGGVRLVKGDARTFRLGTRFDAVLMSGVLSIFDEPEVPMARMLEHLKPGGRGFVFGGFCSGDIDVLVRYRNHFTGSTAWESGLNMFSLRRFKKWLGARAKGVRSEEFRIPADLRKRANPVRTFTLNTREKGRVVVNGANIVREFYCVEFTKGDR